jgi:hypothetical protein
MLPPDYTPSIHHKTGAVKSASQRQSFFTPPPTLVRPDSGRAAARNMLTHCRLSPFVVYCCSLVCDNCLVCDRSLDCDRMRRRVSWVNCCSL